MLSPPQLSDELEKLLHENLVRRAQRLDAPVRREIADLRFPFRGAI